MTDPYGSGHQPAAPQQPYLPSTHGQPPAPQQAQPQHPQAPPPAPQHPQPQHPQAQHPQPQHPQPQHPQPQHPQAQHPQPQHPQAPPPAPQQAQARPEPAPESPESAAAREALSRVRVEVAKAVVGQDAAVTGLVIALLCRGHVLLEGVPGVAKTLLVRALSAALRLETTRVQFTPDLMPGDVTGSLVYDARTAEFSFREGPVFTNLLLADEINRTPPKTQASLLEAMEERQVSRGRAATTAAGAVRRRRHPEPGRVRGHLPAARGPAGPVPAQAHDAAAAARDVELEVLARHAAGFDPRDLAAAGVRAVAGPADLAAARRGPSARSACRRR